MSALLDKDIERARAWLIDVSVELMKRAMQHETATMRMVDKVMLINACALLPGDMPLRVRIMPNVFTFKA